MSDPLARHATYLAPPQDDGCCARTEGYGHDGPCVWKCSGCGATGRCLVCGGDGEDGSGLPDTCMECGGSGQCQYGCDEGWCTE